MTDKAILVTGGAGYIGSHVVLQLVAAGERVVVLDNLSTGFESAVIGAELVHPDVAAHRVGQGRTVGSPGRIEGPRGDRRQHVQLDPRGEAVAGDLRERGFQKGRCAEQEDEQLPSQRAPTSVW